MQDLLDIYNVVKYNDSETCNIRDSYLLQCVAADDVSKALLEARPSQGNHVKEEHVLPGANLQQTINIYSLP